MVKYTMMKEKNLKLVLFDGECGLCDNIAQFLIKQNNKHPTPLIKMLPQNSPKAEPFLKQFDIDIKNLNSVIFIENDQAYIKMDAIFKICSTLGYPYKFVLILKVFPISFLNHFYSFFARNRHKLQSASCLYLDEKEKKKHFL